MLNARRELQAGPHPIGWQLGLAASTVHAILRRHGASRLNPTPPQPVLRYERERPGELLHIDVKRLGRATQGVIVMRLREGEIVSTLAPVMDPGDDEVGDEPDADPAA